MIASNLGGITEKLEPNHANMESPPGSNNDLANTRVQISEQSDSLNMHPGTERESNARVQKLSDDLRVAAEYLSPDTRAHSPELIHSDEDLEDDIKLNIEQDFDEPQPHLTDNPCLHGGESPPDIKDDNVGTSAICSHSSSPGKDTGSGKKCDGWTPSICASRDHKSLDPAPDATFKYSINTDPVELFSLNTGPDNRRKIFAFNFCNDETLRKPESKEPDCMSLHDEIPKLETSDPNDAETVGLSTGLRESPSDSDRAIPAHRKMFFFHINNDSLKDRSRYNPTYMFARENDLVYSDVLKELGSMRSRMSLAYKRRRAAARKGKLRYT